MNIVNEIHQIWWNFDKFLTSNFGEDYNNNLHGVKVMDKIDIYVKSNPSIKIVRCDDNIHATSYIVLVPHPTFGITVIFVPQCTDIKNTFFLYPNHISRLNEELLSMKKKYNLS